MLLREYIRLFCLYFFLRMHFRLSPGEKVYFSWCVAHFSFSFLLSLVHWLTEVTYIMQPSTTCKGEWKSTPGNSLARLFHHLGNTLTLLPGSLLVITSFSRLFLITSLDFFYLIPSASLGALTPAYTISIFKIYI